MIYWSPSLHSKANIKSMKKESRTRPYPLSPSSPRTPTGSDFSRYSLHRGPNIIAQTPYSSLSNSRSAASNFNFLNRHGFRWGIFLFTSIICTCLFFAPILNRSTMALSVWWDYVLFPPSWTSFLILLLYCFVVDADMEDYGFEYSDEEGDEQDVDIENEYYNSKGFIPCFFRLWVVTLIANLLWLWALGCNIYDLITIISISFLKLHPSECYSYRTRWVWMEDTIF